MDQKKKRKVYWVYVCNNPSQGERHYLRLLLHNIPGATKHMKTYGGITYTTLKKAAMALGLLESDEKWDECMSEAEISFMPVQLHSLFVTILIFGEPANLVMLWDKYKEVMGEDLFRQISTTQQTSVEDVRKLVDNEVFLLLQEDLEAMGTSLEQFGLPTPNIQERIQEIPKIIQDELFDVGHQKEVSYLKCQRLNRDQQDAFCMIMKSVHDDNHE